MNAVQIIVVFLLSSAFSTIFFLIVLRFRDSKAEKRNMESYKRGLAEADLVLKNEIKNLEQKIDDLKNDFVINVHPYKSEIKQDYLIFKKKKIEYGYKYQLFVKGLPCMPPATIPVNILG